MTKNKIVFFTGSGISKESGIDTFRDAQEGLRKRPVKHYQCAATEGIQMFFDDTVNKKLKNTL